MERKAEAVSSIWGTWAIGIAFAVSLGYLLNSDVGIRPELKPNTTCNGFLVTVDRAFGAFFLRISLLTDASAKRAIATGCAGFVDDGIVLIAASNPAESSRLVRSNGRQRLVEKQEFDAARAACREALANRRISGFTDAFRRPACSWSESQEPI